MGAQGRVQCLIAFLTLSPLLLRLVTDDVYVILRVVNHCYTKLS